MEGVEGMSVEFNRRMHKLFPGNAAWYKLFKQMDDDGSGKITFTELLDMVRNELEFTAKEVSDSALKRVWAALDDDRSGYLTSGEFGAFMRKGEAALRELTPQRSWKEKRTEKNRLEAAALTLTLTLAQALTLTLTLTLALTLTVLPRTCCTSIANMLPAFPKKLGMMNAMSSRMA